MITIKNLEKGKMLTVDEAKEFAQIYSKYHRLMYSVAWKFSQDPADVEDIVSDSNLALMKNIATLINIRDKQLPSYIATTVKNIGINYLRKRDKEKKLTKELVQNEIYKDMYEECMYTMHVRDKYNVLLSELRCLTNKEGAIIYLRFFKGVDTRGISEIMGLSTASIRAYISRARKKLGKRFEENPF